MIQLKEIKTKKEMKQFVLFPFSLYKDSKYWVPPIINDEIKGFDPNLNPVLNDAKAQFFLAIKDGEIVGRIAAIINYLETQDQGIKKMRFGWFDVIDDLQVSTVLIDKVKEIAVKNDLNFIEGPVGFNNLDKVGTLVEGFDHIGTMVTWYNFPYYKDHLEQLGFVKEKEYLEHKFPFSNVGIEKYIKASKIIQKRYNVKALNYSKTKDIMPRVNEMFKLFSETYSKLSSFVPISDEQIEYFKKKYISFINPEYIKFVVDDNDKLIAFAIVMPSFSKALQKAKGKLFPMGIFHLLKAKKSSKDVTFYLIGVHPEYQNKGVIAIIFEEFHKTFSEKNIDGCYRTPELANNEAINKIWQHFKPEVYKRRRTYRLDL